MSQWDRLPGRLPWLVTLVLVLTVITAGCQVGGTPAGDRRPTLFFDPSVGSDLRTLASETWDQFLAVFRTRTNCFGDVHVRAAYQLGSRGGYDPDTATVTIQVPGTPAKLQSALIHEWAHHVEFQCPEHQALRAPFLAAQGLPPDTPWFSADPPATLPASDWADIPSEQYAEATIELVLGRRPIPTTARVTQEAVRVVEAWAAAQPN